MKRPRKIVQDVETLERETAQVTAETRSSCTEMLFSELTVALSFAKLAEFSRSRGDITSLGRQLANADRAKAAIAEYGGLARLEPTQKKQLEDGLAKLNSVLKTFAKEFPEMATKKASGKRELINTGTDKRFVKRDAKGKFKESADVTRSLRKDVKQTSKRKVKPGYGDRGDRARA